jgi:hypothetical protein
MVILRPASQLFHLFINFRLSQRGNATFAGFALLIGKVTNLVHGDPLGLSPSPVGGRGDFLGKQ